MKTVLFWILVGSVTLVTAEVIENTQCDTGRDATVLSALHEITVDPCPGAEDGEPCELHRGSNATVSFRFTPTHTPTRLKSSIAWVKGNTDLAFRAMRPDACLYMDCPVRANEEMTFSATLSLGSTLPTGLYPLKVKLQEVRGRKRVFACQLFDIKLTDPE
ncbi:MD-2-related lipid-recognition protein [Orchesella cincta]|uniref:MD-2-related lipid-recognition protein n=1 Tax=Orchesella cincta TaxID=48709 RepID=A0A1D2N6D5_ORCCI|nr:MD-2-related lipid-recognition protein [Orchesella cincta]